jgi:phosphate transport system permease protein
MAVPDPAYALTPSGNLRRRMIVSRAFQGAATGAAVLAVGVLGILIYYVAHRGIGALSWGFLTHSLPPAGDGIGPAIAGTLEMVLIAAIIAGTVGLLTAIFLSEFAGPRLGGAVRLLLDLMTGLPTVVIGVFVFGLLVSGSHDSGIAGSVALAIVMVPLIARASLEALARVPTTLRDAADALGVARWRTVLGIIVPSAMNGIATGTILAIARGAGETAPLLFTTSVLIGNGLQLDPTKAMPSIPIEIFTLSEAPDPTSTQQAWGAAFVLLAAILIINIIVRTLTTRAQRKFG